MRIRSLIAFAATLVTALALAIGTALPVGATANNQQHVTSAVASLVTVTGKNTLPQTSPSSPGFTSRAGRTVIAWNGTDPAHHLTVSTSQNGLTNYTNTRIVDETSGSGPAVVQMSEAAGSAVILAWTGTDAAHRLNLLFDVYGQRKKVTFNDNSFTSPGLTIFKGELLLAWAGNDPNHSLNVMRISLSSLTMVQKRTFTFGSFAGPTLATVDVEKTVPATNEAVLGWTNKSNHLQFANAITGLNFTPQPALADTSPFAPVMIQFHTEGGPEFWIAWTGTDSAHHLNVKWTTPQAFPSITGNKTVLPETAVGHPGLGFNNGLFLAWTGTDLAHHLNVLRFEGI